MHSSCRVQSELRPAFRDWPHLAVWQPFVPAIVARPVVAGIVGRRKFIYDLWGDTVNLASRMESHGIPDAIQVTRPVFEKMGTRYTFDERGPIELKGKGTIETWILRSK
jgi:class 3 adenylate cyclase